MQKPKDKKILIITYYWPPSGGSGVQRWVKFAKYLKKFGWTPIVLTVDPNKASYFQIDNSQIGDVEGIETYYTNSIEPLNWLSKLIGKKNIPHSGFSNVEKSTVTQKMLRFFRGNLYVVDLRKGWNKYAFKKAKEIIQIHDIKNVITTSPPHSTQLIGRDLKDEMNINWIADLRDPWTDIFYYQDFMKLPFIAKKEKSIENSVLQKADKVFTVSRHLQLSFRSQVSNPSKVYVVENGFDPTDEQVISNAELTDVKLKGAFNIAYVGVIGELYNIKSFIKAFKTVVEKNQYIHLTFIGHHSEAIVRVFKEFKLLQNVSFVPYLPKHELNNYYKQVDLALLVIPDSPNNEGIITGKIFEYISRQLPVLGIGPLKGDAAFILNETNSGKMYNYDDQLGIAGFIEDQLMRRNNFTFDGVDKYSREALTVKMLEYLVE